MQLKLSVIIPCFNEEDVIEQTYTRLVKVMTDNAYKDYELIFIDDGSKDRTLEILEQKAAENSSVKVLSFSRNFGHQPGVCAGIQHASGDVAIIIDADLQDPPELFPDIIAKYLETKANVVYCVRKNRQGVSFFKKMAYKLFYRIVNYLSDVDLPLDAGDFRLIDKHVIEAFKGFKEKNKYVRGIISWMGFAQVPFEYERPARAGGETKYSIRKLFHLASVGMFYFSKKPLKLATNVGLFSLFVGIVLIVYVIISKLSGKADDVPGWASLMISMVFFGGIQLFTIGVLGEYIGNIFDEVKNRPEYVLKKKVNF